MRKQRSNGRGQAFGIGLSGSVMMILLIGFADLTTNGQILGLAAAAIATPYVNDPPKNNGDKRLKVNPVALFERLNWGSRLPHDLDLWTHCYNYANGEKSNEIAVGYSRKSDGWLDLLRDDQGGNVINEEQLQSNSEVQRVPPNTVCRFNVHLYNSHGGKLPVEGHLIVIQNKDGDDEDLVADVSFTLKEGGEEITIITAAWDEHGNLIKDVVGTYPHVETELIATRK